jgi:N-acetylglutamate synthase-like GNAT family acetyltransferase
MVAEEDDAVIGIGQIKRHWDGTPELASLVVAEDHRGQGVGSALVRALLERHTANHGEEHVYLFCLAQLGAYYGRLGFRIVSRQTLPWPLAVMHLLGNGLGQLSLLGGNKRIQIIAMCYDPASY